MDPTGVHVYPVGVLRQLYRIRATLRPSARGPLWGMRVGRPGWRRSTIRHALRCIRDDSKRRSAWNGYLAEPTGDGIHWTRCGHGWTKRRAEASLIRHIGEVQRDGYLRVAEDEHRNPCSYLCDGCYKCRPPKRADASCGTCDGSGIAPDQSPQPDDEQPCPECVP